MAPVVAEIALEYKDTFIVVKLNSGNNPITFNKYPFRGHPAYLVFQDGEVVGRFVREMPKEVLLENILSVIDVEEN